MVILVVLLEITALVALLINRSALLLLCSLGILLTSCNRPLLPQKNPFIGKWIETSSSSCDLPEFNSNTDPIGELHFENSREFSVTWRPFESYRDYWGTYTYDSTNGSIVFSISDGNYVPDHFDGEGEYVINDNDHLILKNIFLGGAQNAVEPQLICSYEFSRYKG